MMDAAMIIKARSVVMDDEKEMLRLACRQSEGFNGNDETYVPVKVSEEIVAKMKELECNYNKSLGFHSPFPIKGLEMVVLKFDDVAEYDATYKRWRFPYTKCRSVIGRLCTEHLNDEGKSGGDFVGEIGDVVTVVVKLSCCSVVKCHSDFGDLCKTEFKDKDGNVFLWYQRVYKEDTLKEFIKKFGKRGYVTVNGSVKGHMTFHGIRTTTLKRCDIYGKKGNRLYTFSVGKENTK